jgi:hypothetical protein
MFNKLLRMSKPTSRPNWKGGTSYGKWGENPFPVDYALEEDVISLLEPEVATY